MTDTRKVIQQALEALELAVMSGEHGLYRDELRQMQEAIEALKALAQQGEQQPVAWYLPQGTDDSLFRDHRNVVACTGNKWEGWVPLYTRAVPAAQPLTAEHIEAAYICHKAGHVSVSMVQRRMRTGYNYAQKLVTEIVAAHLVDGLEVAGLPNSAHGIGADK